jgi:hypothetical protein
MKSTLRGLAIFPQALAERATVMTRDEANSKSSTSSAVNWLPVEGSK